MPDLVEKGYRPLRVDPTKNYPYPTDEEFIRGQSLESERDALLAERDRLRAQLLDEQGHEDDPLKHPGLVEEPTMDFEGGEATGIFEIDGKHYILPTQVEGQRMDEDEVYDRFRDTGEHLGAFDNMDDALHFEQQYLGKE